MSFCNDRFEMCFFMIGFRMAFLMGFLGRFPGCFFRVDCRTAFTGGRAGQIAGTWRMRSEASGVRARNQEFSFKNIEVKKWQ